ncbi:MAG: hypothetical protein ACRD8Z_02875 [Nitrososphaeraceae archaeon]
MPKLIKEYNETGETKPFDKLKIRNMARDDPPGFTTGAWDETYLQNELDALVLKGLIEERGKDDDKGDIQYQISNHSLQWKLE